MHCENRSTYSIDLESLLENQMEMRSSDLIS